MRVLVAPAAFAGTLTAVQAAQAIADGWLRTSPEDHLDLAPMADGGPGFLDVLQASLGGELHLVAVSGPYGEEVPAGILRIERTAYVEAAQACGFQLTPPAERDPERATSYWVGQLVAAAIAGGAETVVVGLGGCATNDAGAGLLLAMGASADVPLDRGPAGLGGLTHVRLPSVDARLVLASDVDNPLLGLIGATNVYGAQRGIAPERLPAVDGLLEGLARATDRKLANAKGAGAAGGLGFALMLLGAQREPGIRLVADAVGLAERARRADLVVTGEGSFDFSSRSGKVPYGVAAVAGAAIRPCIVLAGQVLVGAREMRALGVESAYSISELVGAEESVRDAQASLATLAERVARTWSP